MPGSVGSRLGGVRQMVESVVYLLMVTIIARAWYLEPRVVPSGSMATALLGIHRDITCRDCGFPFAVGTDELSMSGRRVVCPNCGYTDNELDAARDLAGERLLVDKSAFQLRPPWRWEVAAFRHPLQANQVLVKRIVGLPGESIQIHRGDVYVNGRPARKTLAELKALAVLVHDAGFPPTPSSGLPARWRAVGLPSGWQPVAGGFTHLGGSLDAASSVDDSPVDWLSYQHWRREPGDPSAARPATITDDNSYNQVRPRLDGGAVAGDLLLSCRLQVAGTGRLHLMVTGGGEEFRVHVDPASSHCTLLHRDGEVATATQGFDDSFHIEMAAFDQQFVLAIDGTLVFRSEVGGRKSEVGRRLAPQTPEAFLAIGSQGLGVEVRELKVFRDVHYIRPAVAGATWGIDQPYRLGPDEYFVLGDNSPLSDDSRTWARPAVAAELLVGKPLWVYFSPRSVSAGGVQFQVPDFTKVRYIR